MIDWGQYIAPMEDQASQLASKGRFGDSMLLHVSPIEVEALKAVAPITTNPDTGQPEAFFLTSLIGGLLAKLGIGGGAAAAAAPAIAAPAIAAAPAAAGGMAGLGAVSNLVIPSAAQLAAGAAGNAGAGMLANAGAMANTAAAGGLGSAATSALPAAAQMAPETLGPAASQLGPVAAQKATFPSAQSLAEGRGLAPPPGVSGAGFNPKDALRFMMRMRQANNMMTQRRRR